MRRAERVIHVHLLVPGEFVREVAIVCLLLAMKAQIFQQQRVARLQRLDHLASVIANAIRRQHDLLAEYCTEIFRDQLKTQLGAALLGPSEMRAQNRAAAVLNDMPNRIEARVDTSAILNFAVLERHVEIASHEHLLAFEVEAGDRSDRHLGDSLAAPEIHESKFTTDPRRTRSRRRGDSNSPIRCRTTRKFSLIACR